MLKAVELASQSGIERRTEPATLFQAGNAWMMKLVITSNYGKNNFQKLAQTFLFGQMPPGIPILSRNMDTRSWDSFVNSTRLFVSPLLFGISQLGLCRSKLLAVGFSFGIFLISPRSFAFAFLGVTAPPPLLPAVTVRSVLLTLPAARPSTDSRSPRKTSPVPDKRSPKRLGFVLTLS